VHPVFVKFEWFLSCGGRSGRRKGRRRGKRSVLRCGRYGCRGGGIGSRRTGRRG
jgi:hypothetical protein